MVTVVCERRFKVAATTPPTVVSAVKVIELPIPPRQSDVIVFDGEGARAGVAGVWLTAESLEWRPGLHPCGIQVRCAREDGAKLGPALEAGWRKLEPAADVETVAVAPPPVPAVPGA